MFEDLDPTKLIELVTPYVTGILTALIILVVGWFASKWGYRLGHGAVKRARFDEALARFAGQGLQYLILAFSLIAALNKMGVETTSVVAIMASAGFAIGLALQGSLANFASGVLLLFFRPLHLGDIVNAGGHTGKVRDIGLFATTFLTPDNEKIIIPNAAITSGSIVNYTTEGTRRAGIDVGVAYGCDLQQVQRLCLEAAASVDCVLEDPAPGVAFVEMAASSLNFKLFVWCEADDYLTMLHEVRSAVYEILERENVEIPFNQIVVHHADVEEAAAK